MWAAWWVAGYLGFGEILSGKLEDRGRWLRFAAQRLLLSRLPSLTNRGAAGGFTDAFEVPSQRLQVHLRGGGPCGPDLVSHRL